MLKGKDAIQLDLWSNSAPFSLWTINIIPAASLCPLHYKGPLTKSLLQNQAGTKTGKQLFSMVKAILSIKKGVNKEVSFGRKKEFSCEYAKLETIMNNLN